MDNLIKIAVLIAALSVAGCERTKTDRAADATANHEPATSQSAAGPAPATTAQASASTTAAAPEQDRLFGTWVARDVDVAMGEVKVQVTFRRDGPVKILAWSDLPLVGKVRDKQAPYDVDGHTISSDALRGGTSVEHRFDGDDLIIEYADGKTVRFKRQS